MQPSSRNALAVHEVELRLPERGRHLVLDHLGAHAVAHDLAVLLDGVDAADVDAHRCEKNLSARPPVVVSGLPNMTPIFSRSWLMKMQVVFDFESEPASLRKRLAT